jgi:hypothetical protein
MRKRTASENSSIIQRSDAINPCLCLSSSDCQLSISNKILTIVEPESLQNLLASRMVERGKLLFHCCEQEPSASGCASYENEMGADPGACRRQEPMAVCVPRKEPQQSRSPYSSTSPLISTSITPGML